MKEPIIHSHITDVLPAGHPLADEQVRCSHCSELVHAANNECMQSWVETGHGVWCLYCWITRLLEDHEDDKFAISVLTRGGWGIDS